VLHEDERAVAELAGCTVKHVHEVLCGRKQSYGVCCLLVEFAKENRAKGRRRASMAGDRSREMGELALEFMDDERMEV
jgi:hypothetical protein